MLFWIPHPLAAGKFIIRSSCRIEYRGALYHLLSRANERSDIFFDEVDRNGFLDTIEEMAERFEIDVFDSVMFLLP